MARQGAEPPWFMLFPNMGSIRGLLYKNQPSVRSEESYGAPQPGIHPTQASPGTFTSHLIYATFFQVFLYPLQWCSFLLLSQLA